MSEPKTRPPFPLMAGLKGRCPRCGQGKLFDGFLGTAKQCGHCRLNYAFFDSGDGPAVLVMFLTGTLVVLAALIVELKYQPEYWVHAVLWLPLTLGLGLGLLRPAKGLMLVTQYHFRAEQRLRSSFPREGEDGEDGANG